MQYFSGRFKEAASELILDFHSSIHFDQRLYRYDIMGSIAHVRGLSKMEIISKEDGELIEKTLLEILEDIENGKITFSTTYEDIHMNIEKILIDRIGDVGKKLHTGRSRNDQVAVDMRLFTKDEVKKIQSYLIELIEVCTNLGSEHLETYMPGFTHLQKAQPISFGHYMFAYSEMFKRDFIRLNNAFELLNYSPLGCVALAGTTYPIDREFTAHTLGFKGPTLNSLDGVSDRDYLIEIMSALSIVMMHLSRFSEEIIIYTSNDFGYIELSDAFSTGSSIMPQKKNPDAAELVRGKTGRVYGDLMALLTTMKGIPLAYNKDMQEDKEGVFDTVKTIIPCLKVMTGMIKTLSVHPDKMAAATQNDFSNATELADYLATKGIPFRQAHAIVGNLVYEGLQSGKNLQDISLADYQKIDPRIEEDVYQVLDPKVAVQRRTSLGGTGFDQVKAQIKQAHAELD